MVSSMDIYGQILRSAMAEIIVCEGLAQCIFVDVPSKPGQTPSPAPELEEVARFADYCERLTIYPPYFW